MPEEGVKVTVPGPVADQVNVSPSVQRLLNLLETEKLAGVFTLA
jgi:hypothetical protein